jgi:hypothetical protein
MAELSAAAQKILRYLRGTGLGQGVYANSAELEALFEDVDECKAAETELESSGLIDVGLPPHAATPNRARAAALTLKGVEFVKSGLLD